MYKSFIFFSINDTVLFHRNDAEEAEWTHQEMSLNCTFPYVPDKAIERGMRIGFEDSFGHFQLFEIRNVKTLEPDHAQQIIAEHIAISELTDVHLMEYKPDEEVDAETAIEALLDGTDWEIGTCTSEASHKPELEMTSVWAALTEVRDMMGLRLEPYVTVSETAVTGRYINVVDNVGTWRGVRLSINKNIEQVGITYDDTNLVTAVYGYGKSVDEEYTPPPNPNESGSSSSGSGDSGSSGSGGNDGTGNQLRSGGNELGGNGTPDSGSGSGSGSDSVQSGDSGSGNAESGNAPDYGANYVTIKNVVWEQTAEHPAKPDGQLYLEDPTATALYGRNGTPRFGFYSNSNVSDDEELCELCWEALKRQNFPQITVDCTISQLYAYGYVGEQIQIGDTVRVEIEPIGAVVEIMCICLTEDLLNPGNTRPTIGRYIKDIVYITKEDEHAAGGGGGGGGGANEEKIEQEKNVYTKFDRTDEYILMQAVSIQQVEGALNTAFSEIYMNAQEIALEVTRATGAEEDLSGRITVNADNITLEVTRAEAAEAAIQLTLDGITISGDVITIKGNVINMGNYVLMTYLQAEYATITDLTATNTLIGQLRAGTADFSLVSCSGDVDCQDLSCDNVLTDSVTINGQSVASNCVKSIGPASASGGVITIPVTLFDGSAGTALTFNIADTQFYQDAVSAADASGYSRGVGEFTLASVTLQGTQATITTIDQSTVINLRQYGNATLYDQNGNSVGTHWWYWSGSNRDEGNYYKPTSVQSNYYNAGQTVTDTYYTRTPPSP